jgi:PPOX class probable F420-dependent enzyme
VDAQLAERLAAADVLWLTTLGERDQPQSSPVWFVWHGDAFHLASDPAAGKIANIRRRPLVSVHLEGAGAGDLVVTVEGTARLPETLDAAVAAAYTAKYADGITRLGTTAAEYLAEFSAAVVVTPGRWRVFSSA